MQQPRARPGPARLDDAAGRSSIMGLLSLQRVLDLTDKRGLLAGRPLADLGADVVQVELPGGSSARRCLPFLNWRRSGPRPARRRSTCSRGRTGRRRCHGYAPSHAPWFTTTGASRTATGWTRQAGRPRRSGRAGIRQATSAPTMRLASCCGSATTCSPRPRAESRAGHAPGATRVKDARQVPGACVISS